MKLKFFWVIFLVSFVIYKGYCQNIDTIYFKTGGYGFGEIKNGQRVGTWCFNPRNNQCYYTHTYLQEQHKIIMRTYDDRDFSIFMMVTPNLGTKDILIRNSIFYLSDYSEGIYDSATLNSVYNFRAEGRYDSFYPNGSFASKGTMKNGLRQGEWLSYYCDSILGNLISYNQGRHSGVFKTYYDKKDAIMVEGQCEDNALIGVWKTYYLNGKIKEEGSYSTDKKPLKVTETNRDSIAKIFPYITDIQFESYIGTRNPISFKSGVWKYYDENGNLMRKEEWKNGNVVSK